MRPTPLATSQPDGLRLAPLLLLAYLAVFCWTALSNFYGSHPGILLDVHAQEALAATQPQHHLSHFIASAAGSYLTGTEGQLLYRPSSLCDYALFYRVSGLGLLDVLFVAGLGLYLFRQLGQPRPGGWLAPAGWSGLTVIGVAALSMFVATMLLTQYAAYAFEQRTHRLFALDTHASGLLYAVFGLVLQCCARALPPAEA